ncbi:uncharacterized protein sb:cb288 isoform X1 [Oreochromis aureus]|uniref:uncharacterized protein sb:cb288 isoform X1 n=1 Tax=Oreochromis aureus TaxID=47969 RepID=UPI001952FE0C|nr:uncharacterized protein sb:cb288 isoform X1 [Oreochromis aureus]
MKPGRTALKMWTEMKNKSSALINNGNSSKMVDLDLGEQLSHAVQQSNVSAAAATHPDSKDSPTFTNGLIPGSIAAALFIAFLLGLYAILWKCMVSPPQRKHNKLRVRVHQRASM